MSIEQILYGLFLAGAIYGGIRQDIKAIHREIASDAARLLALEKRFNQHIDRRDPT